MAKGRGMAKGALLMAPVVLYMTLAYCLIMLGAYAVIEDYSITNHVCGQTYHIWKFVVLNMMLWVFACVSYCVWNGGGEGARARALVLSIFYLAFFTWGVLLWNALSDACNDVLEQQYHVLFWFHRVATIMNGISGAMFVLHEAYLGKYADMDLTISPKIENRMSAPFETPRSPDVHGNGPSVMQSPSEPAQLPSNIQYEYDKIMQNTSSSSLPIATP